MDNFDSRPFEPLHDLEMVNSWLRQRGHDPFVDDQVPDIGLIGLYMEAPCCAIFLRRCDKGLGIIDGLVSTPRATPEVRHLALDLICHRILEIAATLGIKNILAFTEDETVLRRSLKHGFKKSKLQMIALSMD